MKNEISITGNRKIFLKLNCFPIPQANFENFFLYSGRASRTPEATSPPAGGGARANVMLNPRPNVKCRPYHAPLRRYKPLKNEISITGNRKIFRKF